jgi:NAD(P)-dependent dehydrogenase (short-subunit alcohol dehydrogenase family)
MTPPSKLAPVALVTGASQGIGHETARRLVTAGCTVYVAARNRARGTVAAAEIDARLVPLEVTSDESVAAAAAQVEVDVGHLDILVNNAGITGPQDDVHGLTGAGMEQVLATNVVGYVRVIHAFLPLLERATSRASSTSPAAWGRWPGSTTAPGSSRVRAAPSTLPRRPRSTCSPCATPEHCPVSGSTPPTLD